MRMKTMSEYSATTIGLMVFVLFFVGIGFVSTLSENIRERREEKKRNKENKKESEDKK
jgi:hypothetical protein